MQAPDMSDGMADLMLYKFKKYLGSVSREIQNRRLKIELISKEDALMCFTGEYPADKTYEQEQTGEVEDGANLKGFVLIEGNLLDTKRGNKNENNQTG